MKSQIPGALVIRERLALVNSRPVKDPTSKNKVGGLYMHIHAAAQKGAHTQQLGWGCDQ